MNKKRAILYGAIAFAVALLDGAFKIAAQSLPPDASGLTWPVALALHKNYGVIANIPLPLALVIPLTIGVCGALLCLIRKNWAHAPHISLACVIIWFGAIGNLIDRILNNYTTDYLIFFQRSAVNLADALILIGAVLFAWYSKDNSPGAT